MSQLFLDFFRFNGRLLSAGDRLVADLGLTSARWQVMGAVAIAKTPLAVAHIARNMGLTRQAVQRVVKDLLAEGLVAYEENPHHRRAKLVVLTEQGKGVFDAAMQRQIPWTDELAAGLGDDALATTSHVIRTLAARLEGR